MAEEKKTQMGTAPGRPHRPTGSPPIAAAVGTMNPVGSGTPAPVAASESAAIAAADPASPKAKTSYLPQAPDPLIDSVVADRYKIIKKLGEGGMGAVYLALHTVLEKQVALKVLHGEFARKPDLVERFMQEAKAASRIRHENVIDISDFGATPDGLVFFAMELLKGHDLHEEIARTKLAGNLLPWSRTKKIFLQVCSALSAAHSRGIIHRDLKPENIYLVEFLGEGDFVKLLDFGIAKVTDMSGADEGARKLTKTGMLFGTPEYMSPEQARGEKVDHRVDIYAMGCILFQLITNTVPFTAENFMGVLSQHLTCDPPQIAPETLDKIGAPRAIAEIVDKALTKEPSTRWQTIDEMANAIREASGDAALTDRSGKMRAASVPSPAETTRQRPATGSVTPLPTRAKSATGPQGDLGTASTHPPAGTSATGSMMRSKTAWTGNLSVPEETVEPAKPAGSSKLPLIIGAVVLLGGGIAAAVIAMGGDKSTPQPTAGSGSAAVATGSGSAVVQTPPPPPPPEQPKIPAMVSITLDSTPHGAQIVDMADETVKFGLTPKTFSVPGSANPRRFKLVLKGHGDAIVELVPNQETITFTQKLEKGATKPGNVVTKVPDPNKPDTGAVTTPGGETKIDHITVKQPDKDPEPAGSGATTQTKTEPKPDPDPKPDPGVQQLGGSNQKSPCAPDEDPCLKSFP